MEEDTEHLVSPKRGRYTDLNNSSPVRSDSIDAGKHDLSFVGSITAAQVPTALRQRVKKKKGQKSKRKMSKFERRYTQLALTNELIPERKRIDFVLVHPSVSSEEVKDQSKRKEMMMHEMNRDKFETLLRKEGFSIQKEAIGNTMYVKLHCPFKRLCVEAETVKLEMPLKDARVESEETQSRLATFIDKHFETDHEDDFVSASFLMDRIQLYEHHEDPTIFFRPSLRALLCHHILINLDIRTLKEKEEGWTASDVEEKSTFDKMSGLCCGRKNEEVQRKDNKVLKKKGLPYLLMKNTYTDAFILHEDSVRRAKKEEPIDGHFVPETPEERDKDSEQPLSLLSDPRKDLDDAWTNFFKFQPMWQIRNYFGEKIAFYFAWSGMLITSLWIPTLVGFGIFIYGLILSVEKRIEQAANATTTENATLIDDIKGKVTDILAVIKEAFDNDATPYFALIVCLWGTVFLELWKRKRSRLAYEWDVDDFEASEPDRPQFFGTKVKPDPVTNEETWFYPLKRQFLKFTTSASVLIFMICVVLISVTAVIIYRVLIDVDMCPNLSGAECLFLTTIVSSLLNAISILLLGKFYDQLAIWLTDWENHRTQTRYDDALIIKLFAFQFVNSYASCFYIAFFRGRFNTLEILGRSGNYTDSCSGTCMSQLSFQVLVLMIVKPFPKLFKDLVIPFLKKLWRKRPCCRKTKISNELGMKPKESRKAEYQNFLEREKLKPQLGDFTLEEYTEKVILYGFLMLFAASFPLAPLLALLTLLIDIRVDAKRLLWFNRRPLAFIAQDIGMWYDILTFVNFCGVLTNAFLIAFTSAWGKGFDLTGKLWIVIGFEHIVFVLKYILAYMIPDLPTEVRLAMRRERFQVAKKMDEVRSGSMDYTHLFPDPGAPKAADRIEEDDVSVTRGTMDEDAEAENVGSGPLSRPNYPIQAPPRLQARPSNNDLWYTSTQDTDLQRSSHAHKVQFSDEEETSLSDVKHPVTEIDMDNRDVETPARRPINANSRTPLPVHPNGNTVWSMNYLERGALNDTSTV